MAHHWQAWRQLSQEFGFALSVEQLLALAGKPSTAIMELLIEEQVGLAAQQVQASDLWWLACLIPIVPLLMLRGRA